MKKHLLFPMLRVLVNSWVLSPPAGVLAVTRTTKELLLILMKCCTEYFKIRIEKRINCSVYPIFCRVFLIITQLMAAIYWHAYSEEFNNMIRWQCSPTSLCFCHVPLFNRFDQLWGICSLEEIVKAMLSKDTNAS